MLAIRLPSDIEQRLASLAKRTGRTKTFYVREAILNHIENLEDIYDAEIILSDIRSGRSRIYTSEEVEAMLNVEN